MIVGGGCSATPEQRLRKVKNAFAALHHPTVNRVAPTYNINMALNPQSRHCQDRYDLV